MSNPEKQSSFEKGPERPSEQEEMAEKKRNLEERLEKLIGKEVISSKVDDSCVVEINFKGGTVLSFREWNAYDDKPGFEYVEVKLPEGKEKQEKQEEQE